MNEPTATIGFRANILVIDDNHRNRVLSIDCLREAGMDAVAFANADEGLAAAQRQPPDAILSDVLMDPLDGFSFCRTVRSDPALSKVPVVLTTASFLEPQDRALARAVGADALVERSPDLSREIAALNVCLQGRRARLRPQPMAAVNNMYARAVSTQLSRMQHDVRVNDLKFRTLFESSTDALSILDTSGVVLDVNPRWEEIMQMPRERMIGQHITVFAAPGHDQDNFAVYSNGVAARRSDAHVFPITRADGSTVYMEISTANTNLDGTDVVFAVGRDITDIVAATHKLEESEQKFRSLIENIPDVVWSSTPTGKALFISPNSQSLTGYTPEEMMAMHDGERFRDVHPEDRPRLLAAYEALLHDGAVMDVEYRRQHKDGHWVWIHSRAQAVRDAAGRIERIDGVFCDVSRRHTLEEQVRRAQKLEAVGQLTGGVAHDFNNILAVIMANAHFLIDGLPAGDPRRDDAEEVKRAAERAAALTRQLLAFSRQQVLAPADIDLNDLVSGLQKMLRRLISEDIELLTELGASLGLAHADPGQIEQVILNLCVNARDAMPEGGTLLISTACMHIDGAQHRDAADTTPVPSGCYVRLSVCDTGTGMDEATRQRIFEPFFTTKGLGKGTGLGLSTCYGIVKQSGGFIEVDSTPGRGTAFYVYLPCSTTTSPSIRPANPTTAFERGDETVLLVEDDDALRRSLARALKVCGYSVILASCGSQARMLLEEHADDIDLLLSDVVLPDESGLSIAGHARTAWPKIHTMLMSGHTDHALLENQPLRVGEDFLQKPFSPADLALKVRRVLDA